MGLAVISGLVDDVEVTAGDHGGVIRMTWPTTPPVRPAVIPDPSLVLISSVKRALLGGASLMFLREHDQFVNDFTANFRSLDRRVMLSRRSIADGGRSVVNSVCRALF